MRESMEDAEAEEKKIVEEMIEMSQEVAGQVQEQIVEEARRSMEEAASAAAAAASGRTVDDERLPAGAIFNAVLGPVEAFIVNEDQEDAPDGFDHNGNTPTTGKAPKLDEETSLPNDEKEDGESTDPVLEAINSAVSAALEESDVVKTSSKKKTPDDFDDLSTKSGQDAAEENN